MKKKLPQLMIDAEAEAFVENADLTEFELEEMRELRFGSRLSAAANSIPPLDGEGSSAEGRAGGVKLPKRQ